MSIEPEWIEEATALAYHDEQLAEHGGGSGIRDLGLLQSALMRPRNAFHYEQITSRAQLAALYAIGIIKNHPFIDGNKRTAYVVTRAFLILNGYDLTASREEKYFTIYKLAAGELSYEELANWLADNSQIIA